MTSVDVGHVRNLFATPDPHQKPVVKKDKLAETKRAEREVKEIYRAERVQQKEEKHEEEQAMHELYREERQYNGGHSKRAERDARHKAHHDKKVAEGQMCEHGIWKCRICFPHKTDRDH